MDAGIEAESIRVLPRRWRLRPLRRSRGHSRRGAAGFSLIELVIVIVIIAIIAAIAIPRLSRSSEGAADAATAQNVAVLQKAVDLYAAEHGNYPDPDQVHDQLTLYSDSGGAVSKEKSPPFTFGPYVRKLPPLTTGPNKGTSDIGAKGKSGIAWVYDGTTGAVTANMVSDTATSTTQPSSTDGSNSGPGSNSDD
jgi:prepilin-type N-terminal cleavage/methylation domain-containing protein